MSGALPDHITALELDKARIGDWRERLRKARWADGGDGYHRAFAREWSAIRAEYHEATMNPGGAASA